MSSDDDSREARAQAPGSVSYLLFDSLVHHLIAKGVLTKNDGLGIVQTAAQVVQSRMCDDKSPETNSALALLERTYSSFEALPERRGAPLDGHNIHPLRPPLHGERPKFPSDDKN